MSYQPAPRVTPADQLLAEPNFFSERPATLAWPELPTETEIYILPTGEVVVADLPAELAELIAQLGLVATDHQ